DRQPVLQGGGQAVDGRRPPARLLNTRAAVEVELTLLGGGAGGHVEGQVTAGEVGQLVGRLGRVEEVGGDGGVDVEGPDVDDVATRETTQPVRQLLDPVPDQRRPFGGQELGERLDHRRCFEHVGGQVGGGVLAA